MYDDGVKKCCICGREFVGWGNNPDPLVTDEDARCCDDCNSMYVIPARLVEINKKHTTEFVGYDDEGRPMFETREVKGEG